MVFLGKISVDYGGKRLGVTPQGQLSMLELGPHDPSGLFLAYDMGGTHFSLQCYLGSWVELYAAKAPNAWYPVLYSASTGGNPTRFISSFFESQNRSIAFAFTVGDSSSQGAELHPALILVNGINPYCNCGFDVAAGWNLGSRFALNTLLPGVSDLNRTKNGAGYYFSGIGSAHIDLSAASFSNVDFRNAVFSQVKLDKASFIDCDLRGVTISNASLNGAVFRGSTLSGAKFSDSNISHADMSGINLENAKLSRCNLDRAKFNAANLRNADFRESPLAGADFSLCDLSTGVLFPAPPLSKSDNSRVIFHRSKLPAHLIGQDWSNLDLTEAKIEGLEKTNLSALKAHNLIARGIALNNIDLKNADFTSADISMADLSMSNLSAAKFNSSTLCGAIFSGCKMGQANFYRATLGFPGVGSAMLRHVYLENANFDASNLYGVDMSYATISGSNLSLRHAETMERAKLDYAYLAGLDLSRLNLRGSTFVNACLINVNFSDANLEPSEEFKSSLVGAALQGAKFTRAKLEGANLSNAAVSFVQSTIPVRYCDGSQKQFPPPPETMQLQFDPTTGLGLNTMGKTTICPNGYSVQENESAHLPVFKMLTAPIEQLTWFPVDCGKLSKQ